MAKKFAWLGQEDLDSTPDEIDPIDVDTSEEVSSWRPDARTISVLSELQITRKSAISKEDGGVYEYQILQAINNIDSPLDRVAVLSALANSVYLPVATTVQEVFDMLVDIPDAEVNAVIAGYVAGSGKYATLHQYYAETVCLASDEEYAIEERLSALIETVDDNPDVYSAISACTSELDPQDAADMRPSPYYAFDKLIGFMAALVSARAKDIVDEDNPNDPFVANVNLASDKLDSDQIDTCRSKLLQMVKSVDVVAMSTDGDVATESMGDITQDEWRASESARVVSSWVSGELDKYHALYADGKYQDAYVVMRELVGKVTPSTAITETAVIIAVLFASNVSIISRLSSTLASRITDGESRNIFRLDAYGKYDKSQVDGKINYYVGDIKPKYTVRVPAMVMEAVRIPIDVMTVTRIEAVCIKLEASENNIPWEDYCLACAILTIYTSYANAVNGKKHTGISDAIGEMQASTYIKAISVLKHEFPEVKSTLGLESFGSTQDIINGFISFLTKAVALENEDDDDVVINKEDDKEDDEGVPEMYTDMPPLPDTIQTGTKVDDDVTADPTGALYADGSRRIAGAVVAPPSEKEPETDYTKNADDFDIKTEPDGDATVTEKKSTPEPKEGDDDSVGDDEIDKDYIDHYGNGDVKVVESRNPKDILDETVDGFMSDFNETENEIENADASSETDTFDGEVDGTDADDIVDGVDDTDTGIDDDSFGDEEDSDDMDADPESDDAFGDDVDSDDNDSGELDDIDATGADDTDGDSEGFTDTDLDSDGIDDTDSIATDEATVNDANVELSDSAGVSSDNIVKLKAIEALRAIATESILSPIAEKMAFDQVRHLANVEFTDDDNTVADVIMASQELIISDLNEGVDELVGNALAYVTAASTLSHNLYVRLAEIYNKVSTLNLDTEVQCTNGTVLNAIFSDAGIDLIGIKSQGLNTLHKTFETTEQELMDFTGERRYCNAVLISRTGADDILGHTLVQYASDANAIITYRMISKIAIYAGLYSKAMNTSNCHEVFAKKLGYLVTDYKRAKERTSCPAELNEYHLRVVNYIEVIHAYVIAHTAIPLAVSKLPSRLSQIIKE